MPDESEEQLHRKAERDRRRVELGLVPVMDRGGTISHKHVEDLGRLETNARTAAERLRVDWLKERVESSKQGTEKRLPYPHIYYELLELR